MMKTSQVIYIGGLRTRAVHLKSGQEIITDAPIDNQGRGEYFSPTDLAATSLASCMLTIMGIAANSHGFSIDGAVAEVTKIMSDGPPRRISRIIVELSFPGNRFTDKQKAMIEKISSSCPVALSLHPEIIQEVRIVFSDPR